MGRYVILLGGGDYNALNAMSLSLACGLREIGNEVIVMSPLDVDDFAKKLELACADKVDLIISFNGRWVDLRFDDDGFVQWLRAPFLSILTDSYNYNYLRIAKTKLTGYEIFSFADRLGRDYAWQFLKNKKIKDISFVPMFAIEDAESKKSLNKQYWNSKDFDIVWFGFPPVAPQRIWNSIDHLAVRNILDNIADVACGEKVVSFFEAINDVVSNQNLIESEKLFASSAWFVLLSYVESYWRHYRRRQVADVLLTAGMRIDVFGNGWRESKYGSVFNCHEAVNMVDVPAILRRSKVSINSGPHMSWGLQERIPTAMANGAVVVSDYSGYCAEYYSDNEDLLFYDYNKIALMPDFIDNILKNDKKRLSMCERAMEKTQCYHSAKSRARQIVDEFNFI